MFSLLRPCFIGAYFCSGGAWLSTNLPFLILLGFILFFSLFKFK
jgi:hypothetical protein